MRLKRMRRVKSSWAKVEMAPNSMPIQDQRCALQPAGRTSLIRSAIVPEAARRVQAEERIKDSQSNRKIMLRTMRIELRETLKIKHLRLLTKRIGSS